MAIFSSSWMTDLNNTLKSALRRVWTVLQNLKNLKSYDFKLLSDSSFTEGLIRPVSQSNELPSPEA